MRTKTTWGFLCFAAMFGGVAHADIDDEKPWDWASYESSILRNKDENGTCDAIALSMKYDALQCAFDKKAWDDHLKKEIKIEKLRKRNHQQPSSCGGGVFQAFRDPSENGSWPSTQIPDGLATIEEFKKTVAVITCSFDDSDKEPYITYDPAKKNLTVHLTRKETWNSLWIVPALREGELKKRFPVLDKFFRKRE